MAIAGLDIDFTKPGALGQLADHVWDTQPEADGSDVFEYFMEWAAEQGVELWEHQEEALTDLALGDHVILGTPTGSGKSMVALGLAFMALATGKVFYYTAPIKALVSEKFFNMVDLLGRDLVGMVTGDASINNNAPVICCTAEILANEALSMGEKSDVACVAMDEFHYFGDSDRGWAWQIPLLTLPNTQFLLMSATLGDTSHIAGHLKEFSGRDVDMVVNAPRPVPLSFEYVDTALEGTVELAIRKGEAPLYLVHFSQDAALASAQALTSFGIATKEQRAAIKDACAGTSFNTAFGKILQRLLGCGVGVHHAGMLPRYRLLVEKLAQQGLLPIICGTDTLGVGINVPIHTVVITSLTKYDGHKQRRLNAREFHQIAGRAGRAGFDTEGVVLVEAPEHEIENAALRMKAGNDPKKLRKLKLKKPPEGHTSWNKSNYERLVEAQPEQLHPRMKMSHGMVLNVVERGGDARAAVAKIIDSSLQSPEEKLRLHDRAEEVFATLLSANIIGVEPLRDEAGNLVMDADGKPVDDYFVETEMPANFALDEPLSPFLLAALELLDPESDTYALDVVSMVEATVEDPRQLLRIQERRARDKAYAEMKADGVEYEERLERLEDITYPKPLADLLGEAFRMYCKDMPWASDYELAPKSVLREMLETGATFKGYIASLGAAKCEGILLRYLSDAYRVLERTVPPEKYDEQLADAVSWLGVMVRSVDSSLVDEWANAADAAGLSEAAGAAGFADGSGLDLAAPGVVVTDRRGLQVMVRNALFQRVKLLAASAAAFGADANPDDPTSSTMGPATKAHELGQLDLEWNFGERAWREAIESFYEAHEEARIDADARSSKFLQIDEADEKADHVWHVVQVVADSDEDHDFRIMADVDLDATQDGGDVVFMNYRVGFFEDLLA